MRRAIALVGFVIFSLGQATAASLVDQYVVVAARAANAQYQKEPPNDGITRSARAYAQGPILVYEMVLAFRKDTTERELAAWRTGNRSEVFSSMCAHLKKDEFFISRGLQVRYRYLERDGRVLDEFTVNKPGCQGL